LVSTHQQKPINQNLFNNFKGDLFPASEQLMLVTKIHSSDNDLVIQLRKENFDVERSIY